jgi:hypothetical protein
VDQSGETAVLNLLRKLVLAASLGAGIASFVSVASALPVLDALAIKNAAPPTLEGGASQLGQRESSDNPILNAFWRVAPSDRLKRRAIDRAVARETLVSPPCSASAPVDWRVTDLS